MQAPDTVELRPKASLCPAAATAQPKQAITQQCLCQVLKAQPQKQVQSLGLSSQEGLRDSCNRIQR